MLKTRLALAQSSFTAKCLTYFNNKEKQQKCKQNKCLYMKQNNNTKMRQKKDEEEYLREDKKRDKIRFSQFRLLLERCSQQ